MKKGRQTELEGKLTVKNHREAKKRKVQQSETKKHKVRQKEAKGGKNRANGENTPL